MTTTSPAATKPGGLRVGVQRFGTFLSGMIMPNIAAFIAWGFITMLFIAVGWLGWWHPVSDLLGGFGNGAKGAGALGHRNQASTTAS